jgi:serine/arginine repetitive matrix protein 2
VSASASLAASQAFLKDRESNPNLSNAAAAAALRTHVTTPPPVGDTVTKRMLRRNSASSNGSAAIQQRPGALHRQSSSGSMTERTFRSPSPGRNPSPPDATAPPVPSLPKNVPQSSIVHRRASSLEPINRGGSPSPRGSGRGVSLDRGSGPSTGGRGQRATSNLAQVLEDDQDAAQRSSVNFSRPMSPASAAKSGWFGGPVVNQDAVQRMALTTTRPKTSSGVASADLRNTQQSVQNAANRPVSTYQVLRGVEGSRISSGSMRAKPSGTAVESRSFLPPVQRHAPGPVDPKSPDAVFDPSTRTFVHKQDAMARHRELHEEPEQPAHHYVAQHLEEHSAPRVTQRQPLPLPRTPSPARRPAQREESPAVRRREEVALPRLDTSAPTRGPDDPPTRIPAHVPHSASDEAADADRRPLEQANTSRQLENTAQPTHIDVMVSPKMAGNQDSAYPRMVTPVLPTTTNALAGQGRGSVRTEHGRGHSLSPPRNAHFAPVAVELAGVKHQPPPRSISPAKSALKSSPSVSRRGTSPGSQNGRLLGRGTPSEVSDTTSEGGSSKKRRSVRVSFEEEPIVAGTSADADAVTPTTATGLGASKWSPKTEKENEFEDFMKPRPALPLFGSVRDKERRSAQDDVPEKVTETVSSTPLSASVGSMGEPLQASSDHALASIVSHDLAQKQTSGNDPLPPEVTTVEGSGYVSDSSDEADRSTRADKHGSMDDSSQILPVPEPKSLTAPHDEKLSTPSSIKESVVGVPNIALQPATPSPYEKPEPIFQPLVIPGGWNDDVPEADNEAKAASTTTPTLPQPAPAVRPAQHPTNLHELVTRDEEDSSDDNSSVYSDAYEDLDDGGFASIDALMESPVASKSSGLMFSKYADKAAAESTSSGLRNETVADDTHEPVTTSSQDWNAAQQHWSGINEARKQPQTEEFSTGAPSKTNDIVARVMAAPVKQEQLKDRRNAEPQPTRVQNKPTAALSQTAQPPPKPLKSALKKPAVAQSAPLAQTQPQIRKTMREQAYRDDGATQSQMRSSMRGPPGRDARSAEPQMRKSMRSGPTPAPREQTQMRTSMRGASPVGLAASRHSMPPMDQKPPRAALQKKHIPAGAVVAKPRPQSMATAPMKQAAPIPTYDSDSDASASSFQRARGRRSGNQNSRYTMRASMRQDAAPTMRTAAPAPKQPIRSISPPGSPSPALRKSMRPSSPTPDRPKSSRFSIRSLSPMGRFRTSKPIEAAPPSPTQPRKPSGLSKQPKQKAPAAERAKPAFRSRFVDSSDEDEDGKPSRFQSRFADSDDDEPSSYTMPQGLTPVRGIPRKAGEEDGDSTDLEEELDDAPVPAVTDTKETRTTPAVADTSNGQTNGSTNGQGTILASGSLRDSKHAPLPSFDGGNKSKAKRGFFGLGKKKTPSSPASAPQSTRPSTDVPEPTTKAASFDIPAPPQQRNRDQGLPLTPIDEDKDFATSAQNSPQVTRSPKLQRRSTPEWPLPRNNIPVPPIPDDDARPMSSDGIAPRRPRFAIRTASQMSNATAPDTAGRSVSYGRAGKKKKFQGLRRVFGLND